MTRILTDQEKKTILTHIDKMAVEKLIELIDSEQVTFQEMREHGLNFEKQSEIRSHLEAIEQQKQKMEFAWQEISGSERIEDLEDFMSLFPGTEYASQAEVKIELLKKKLEREREQLFEEIRNDPDYSQNDLKTHLESGRISREELVEEGIITHEGLDLILNPPAFFVDQNSWTDLEPLPDGPTDIYFFGIPGSGKSCVLSGVFSRASARGILRENTDFIKGVRYMNNLKKCAAIGYAPPRTNDAQDTVNFIQCKFKDKKTENVHDLSFVEMSGEFFRHTYLDNTIDGNRSIGAKGYLKNDNQKLIFLVIDYQGDGAQSLQDDYTQEDLLVFVLDKLSKDGTLKKALSIQIIVTKSDLIESDDKMGHVKEFLQTNYPRLIELIKELNRTFNINKHRNYDVVYHAFSYGRFMIGKTFQFNPVDSDKLILTILNSTQPDRKKGTWEFLKNKK